MAQSPTFIDPLEGRCHLSAAAAGLDLPAINRASNPILYQGVIRNGSQRQRVSLFRNDGTARPLRNIQTWVIAHGWVGQPDGVIKRLADAVDGNTRRDQVLLLDWSGPASSLNPLNVVSWVPPIARWVATTLRKAGLANDRINLVGHSLGGYMVDAIATNVSGGVNRIVALDPATDLLNLNLLGVNYAAHSRYSQAFIGSFMSTPRAAFTADEAISVNVGDYNNSESHIRIVDLYNEMLRRGNAGRPDRISRLFDVDLLNSRRRRPWKANAYQGGFEAVLTGRGSDDNWMPSRLQYISVTNGRRVVLRAG